MGLEWLALLLFYLLEPKHFNGQYAISYFGSLPVTKPIYIICYLGAAITFWLFANYHFKNHFRTPIGWFAFSMLAMVAIALWPYEPSEIFSIIVHNSLAFASFGAFWIGMILVAKHSDSQNFRLATYLGVLVSVLLMLGFVLAPINSYWHLGLEASSWFICQVWIIWISIRAFSKQQI